MDDSGTRVEIDHGELAAHQQRLRGLLERVDTAGAASGEAGVGPMAFGFIGQATLLGVICANSAGDGVAMLRQVRDATEDHIARVGAWACEWDGREGDAVSLFNDVRATDG